MPVCVVKCACGKSLEFNFMPQRKKCCEDCEPAHDRNREATRCLRVGNYDPINDNITRAYEECRG